MSTFDQVPPYRPGLADVGGAAKENDANYPPDPVTMITADDWNETSAQVVAQAQTARLALVTVLLSGTTYSIGGVASVVAAVSNSTFTVTRNAQGNVLVSWPAGTFPTPAAPPEAWVNGTVAGFTASESLTNSAEIHIANSAGALDAPFTLAIH